MKKKKRGKKKKPNEKYRKRQTKEKEKEKLKQDGCNRKKEKKKPRKWVFLVNPVVFGGPTNNIPSFPLSFHCFSFLVHLLLGNCHVHTTPLATISQWTLFSSSTDCVFLSLFISSTLTTWTASSRSSLLSYSILCVNSLFFLFIYLLNFGLCSIFCLIDGKTVEKEEKGQIYFWVFCVFLFYFWIFPLVAVVIIK